MQAGSGVGVIKGGFFDNILGRVPRSWRRRAWRGTVAVRRAATRPTAPLRVLPDYLIAGGQRCGTTSLQNYLIQHPDVTPPGVLKGIHYYDMHYDRGLAWYQSHFPTRMARSRRVRNGGKLVTGEASPYYMFHPLIPERIAETVPEAKIIILARDPVERTYSHYLHEVRRGFEDLTFEEALNAEETRLAGEVERMRNDPAYVSFEHQHHSYVARGRYMDQLENMTKHIAPEQILVIASEEMFSAPEETYHRVLDFLELSTFTPTGFKAQNANVYTDPIAPETRRRLEQLFAEPNRRLESFVGRTFDWSS
jgi:hypothetical protein